MNNKERRIHDFGESRSGPGWYRNILFHEFLVIQHYIREEREPFTRSLMQTRALMADNAPGLRLSRLLLDTLEANQAARDGEWDRATGLYRRLIERETKSYRGMLRRAAKIPRPDLAAQRLALALLSHNLGLILAEERTSMVEKSGLAPALPLPTDPGQVEGQFRRAIEYEPESVMIRRSLADFYLSNGLWDEAITCFREAYAASALDEHQDDWKVLNSSLANVALQKAAKLAPPPSWPPVTNPPEQELLRVRQALEALDWSASSVEWKDIPGLEAKTHFERAQLLQRLGRYQEAARLCQRSAELYRTSADFSSAAYVQMRAGDIAARFASLPEIRAAYDRGLEDVPLIQSDNVDTGDIRQNQRRLSLLDRLAFVNLVQGDREASRKYLAARVSTDQTGWGAHYEVLLQATSLLGRTEVRYPVNILYHELLACTDVPESRRDLTAAVLKLYEYERDDQEADPVEADTIRDGTLTKSPNVVTPLTIEISEAFADREQLSDAVVERYATPVRTSLAERFGVRVPGVRLRASRTVGDGQYVIMIGEVPLASGTHSHGSLDPVFQHLERLLTANLVELFGHQEAQNYLERNLLVRPTVADVAEKENAQHMDPLAAVLRALLTERVPLQGAWRFSDVDLTDLRSLAERIAAQADSVSTLLHEHLSATTITHLNNKTLLKSPALAEAVLRPALIGDLNRFIEQDFKALGAERWLQNGGGETIGLRPETRDRALLSPQVRESRVVNRMLLEDAYPHQLARGPLEYPGRLYQAFRRGWEGGQPLSAIVETIRRIPEVRARLWGNDGSYTPLLLPPAFEGSIQTCVRKAGTHRVLILEPGPAAAALDALQAALQAHSKPSLVVTRQELRVLVRALIAVRLPEVPVLTVHEVRTGALRTLVPLASFNERLVPWRRRS